jgi:hypothetical protein
MAYKKTMRVSSKKKSTRKIRSTASKRKTNKKNSRTHKSKSKSKSKKNKKAFRKTKSVTHRNRNHQQGTKKYKGGSDPSRQPLINTNTNTNLPLPTPLLIDMDDTHSITESEVDAMELELADNSWAEDTVNTTYDGDTTREDISDDEDEDDDPLNTAFILEEPDDEL